MDSDHRLRFGLVGLSSDHVWGMGDGLAKQPEVEMVSAAELYPELRDRAVERWGIQRTYSDHEAMLENEKLDAIMVCCDNASKADVVESAARRGVHVYEDKAIAATLEQADRIVRAVNEHGITLMVAYHMAFFPTYHQIKHFLANGVIGRVYQARGSIGHGGPIEFGCSKYFYEWLFDKQRNGGGCFVDEACYMLDQFIDYLGPISEVSALTAQIGHRDYLPPEVEDNAVAVLRFRSGALGILDARWGQVGPAPVMSAYHGLKGTISLLSNGVEMYSTTDPEVPEGWEPVEVEDYFGRRPDGLKGWRRSGARHGGGYQSGIEARAFVDAVLGRRPLDGAVTPKVARDVQEVIEAAYLSAKLGRLVQLPLR